MSAGEGWKPSVILALGGALALVGLGLKLALPALGAGIGLAIAIASGGVAVAGQVASWALPVGAVALAGAGAGTAVIVLARVVRGAAERPFEWLLPVLSVGSGLLVEVSREFYPGDALRRILFGATSSLLMAGGGVLWHRGRALPRCVAAGLWALPPVIVLAHSAASRGLGSLASAAGAIPFSTWIAAGGFLLVALGVAFLHYAARQPAGTPAVR